MPPRSRWWRLRQVAGRERPTRKACFGEFGHPLGSWGTSTTASRDTEPSPPRARCPPVYDFFMVLPWPLLQGQCAAPPPGAGSQMANPGAGRGLGAGWARGGPGPRTRPTDPAPPLPAPPRGGARSPRPRAELHLADPAGGRTGHPAREEAHPGARRAFALLSLARPGDPALQPRRRLPEVGGSYGAPSARRHIHLRGANGSFRAPGASRGGARQVAGGGAEAASAARPGAGRRQAGSAPGRSRAPAERTRAGPDRRGAVPATAFPVTTRAGLL